MKTTLNLFLSVIILAIGSFTGCNTKNGKLSREILLSKSVPEVDKKREVSIRSVFFGLDNGLTRKAMALYKKAYKKDGMPVVFSHEVDPETLDGSDFLVTTQNGQIFEVEYATLLPANEEFELRTALLIGEYGNYPDNEPVSVEIVGDLMTRTGVNYKGQTKEVIPLKEGPILSYAEYFTIQDADYPYLAEGEGVGCDCPREETKLVVKAVWSGGVKAVNGDELGMNEIADFNVTMVSGLDTTIVTPYMLADLSDNDNNIDLCLKEAGIPIWLEVSENVAIDPNDDPNPKTQVEVLSRW